MWWIWWSYTLTFVLALGVGFCLGRYVWPHRRSEAAREAHRARDGQLSDPANAMAEPVEWSEFNGVRLDRSGLPSETRPMRSIPAPPSYRM